MKTYSFEEGKYEFDRDENGQLLAARRHGEPWDVVFEAMQFCKFFHAMLNHIDELEIKREARTRKAQLYSDIERSTLDESLGSN